MRKKNENLPSDYIMFIDESGDSNLNHVGKYFVLSTVIVQKDDFEIIQGYLRLLKRNFLGYDLINLHMTDLCERPYLKYRKLIKPVSKLNSFLAQLASVIRIIPFETGLYFVNKDKVRKKLKYTPGKKKQPKKFSLDIPYELAAKECFSSFLSFLIYKKSKGEIVIESRYPNDGKFVDYFDKARKKILPGGLVNKQAEELKERVNSLTISNKKIINGGLEIADVGSYCFYRKLNGDPFKKIKINKQYLVAILRYFKSKSYLKNSKGYKLGVKEVYF